MCEPMTIAAATAATAAVVGGGIKIAADRRAANFQAAVARNNARLARAQQAQELMLGATEASRIEAAGARAASSARAIIGASGVESTVGSVANIFGASTMAAAADAERVRANAARRAWGYGAEAQNYLAQGRMAQRASILGGIGTGLGAAGSAAGAFSSYR